MNIRNSVPNDHIQSISEIAKSQSSMIQLLTIEIQEKDKEISRLNNIIDELEKWLKDEANFWKQQQEKAIKNGWLKFGGKYNTTIIYENAINKLKKLKGELNEKS